MISTQWTLGLTQPDVERFNNEITRVAFLDQEVSRWYLVMICFKSLAARIMSKRSSLTHEISDESSNNDQGRKNEMQ
jgi:hypothetical protein